MSTRLLVHPMVSILTDEVRTIHSLLKARQYGALLTALGDIIEILQDHTRDKLGNEGREIADILAKASKAAERESTDDWDRDLTVEEIRNNLARPVVRRIFRAVIDALYNEGYLTNEKWMGIDIGNRKATPEGKKRDRY